ncbi:DUF6005 family protein [Paenibacillus sp. GCM10027628]|uniref:DUF6005 family protein n=1 Tax=Paenibacillus sp. GCM10027628 TaxID=3273413 RepID=UPI00363479CE
MSGARQTHCFLDCIAYVMQAGQDIDCRPMYVGIWDASFEATGEGISYYSDSIGIESMCNMIEQLYGISISRLNDPSKLKAENYSTLLHQLMFKNQNQSIIILVDLFYLPYPNQCYRTKHRPHLILVDHLKDDHCFLIDPYFAWNDYVPIEILEESFYCGDLNVAVMIDTIKSHPPDVSVIAHYMNKHLHLSPNRLTEQVQLLIDKVIAQEAGSTIDRLYQSIEQVSVIAKRLNGYEMVYSYLDDSLKRSSSNAYRKIAEINKKWESLLLSIMRISILRNLDGLLPLQKKVNHISQLESELKQELLDLSIQWGGRTLLKQQQGK